MSNNHKEVSVEQQKDLLAQTYHIDGRVTAIEGRIGQIGDQLNRMEASMLNRPPIMNTGNLLTIMGMIVAFLYGISGYVDLRVDSQRADIRRNTEISDTQQEQIEKLKEFQREMHYEVGTTRKSQDVLEEYFHHLDERFHLLDDRVRGSEVQAGEAEVSRKAIGDYAKELGGILHERGQQLIEGRIN